MATAMKTDMAAAARQQHAQRRIARPIMAKIRRDRDPRIVMGVDQQGRHADRVQIA